MVWWWIGYAISFPYLLNPVNDEVFLQALSAEWKEGSWRKKLFCDTWMTFYYLIPVRVCSTFYSMIKSNQDEVFFHSSYPDVPLRNSINRNWMKNSFLLSTMAEKYDHFFYEEIKGEYIDFHEQWWGTVRLQRTMMWLP